jgi:hypothetical protein
MSNSPSSDMNFSSLIADITSPSGEPASKKQRYVHLTTEQFDRLITSFQQSVTNARAQKLT